jgi:glutathione S-transferase
MGETPRLWSFRLSPFAGKARAAFAEKGVDVELVEIHPVRRPDRLRELNPANRVPVLEVGGYAVRESSVIIEWLEETHPDPPLWPADAAARAWARGMGRYVDDALAANYFLGMRKTAFGLADDDPPDVVERLHARMTRPWTVVEEALGRQDGPWLMGETFTYADLSGLALAVRLPEWTPHLQPEHPRAAAWLDALRARPSAAAIDRSGEPVEA